MAIKDPPAGSRGRGAVAAGVVALALALSGTAMLPAGARAAPCSPETEQIRLEQEQRDSSTLPDCRAYEQVSPTNKNLADASGRAGLVQSARSGNAVTFFSILPFPGIPGSSGFPIYLSTRGEGGWSLPQGLLPRSDPGPLGGGVVGWTEELADVITEAPGEAGDIEISTNYGKEYLPLGRGGIGKGSPYVAGSTPDGSTIVVEDEAPLIEGAIEKEPNVYEWHDSRLSLIAADAAVGSVGGAREKSYTESAISEDGSRVFFTDLQNGLIYMDEPQIDKKIAVSNGPATWEAATPEGSSVFYIEGGVLYRFEVDTKTAEPLASEVIGTLGVSADGSYVYFAKSPSDIYLWHDGEVIHIASVSATTTDQTNWYGACVCGGEGASSGGKSSRVTPDGLTLLFSSTESLTGYDNGGHIELYVYYVGTGSLTCVSCNPLANKATSDAYLTHNELPDSPTIQMTFLTRNLAGGGQRVFFQTKEALVPSDVNGQMDVYEWEQEGAGSCRVGSGGCLYLISTGQSASDSYFGDASMEGEDVFFFARQPLVAQDEDYNDDIYDARVDGGIAEQNSTPQAPCSSEESCAGPAQPPPALVTPTSAIFAGSGNLLPAIRAAAAEAKKKAKKTASRQPKGKRAKRHRKSGKRSPRHRRRTA
jgi:hypothetical protein